MFECSPNGFRSCIGADRAVNYRADKRGTKLSFRAVGKAMGACREGRAVEAEWSAEIAEDYEARS